MISNPSVGVMSHPQPQRMAEERSEAKSKQALLHTTRILKCKLVE